MNETDRQALPTGASRIRGMVNHPNRSARRQHLTGYNLLITRVVDGPDFSGLAVVVRDGYSFLTDYGFPESQIPNGRRISIRIPCPTVFDRNAINNLGQRGASVVQVDRNAVAEAVRSLLAEWGSMPVQDNSGRFPDLATVA